MFIGKTIVLSNWDKLPAVINLHTAALIFGVADSTIKRWISSGTLPAHKVGKLWFFNKSDLVEIMQGGGVA
ncbi:MAG: helix-turn-helix domain-containing protein [Oscillospiraceae bacterium]|nr:helix-turn-helix domain-containing protein [Oscillospiraceae bacterium]